MRHDIQGLRAIAVLAVVIFHIVPYSLTGGYLGVDMFFVISGYVISLKIHHDVKLQKFDLPDFYIHRLKRLLPALFAVLLVTTILALGILLPFELLQFSTNLLGALFFVSNFILMTQDGYFDQSSENNPLLHLWSLAVEEHYYLFFPLFFIWLLRKPIFTQVSWVLLLTVFFFALGVWWVFFDRDVAFYLSPLRFYQFLAGVICACYLPALTTASKFRATLAIMSLVTLVACFWFYNKATPSPGWPSLVPTFATMVLLYCAHQSTILNLLLRNRMMVGLGNASYSIYLWHWPIIVYYKLAITAQINLAKMFLLLSLSIFIGYLSWFFIEQPFRNRGRLAGKRLYRAPGVIGLCCFMVLIALAGLIYLQQGFPQRFSAEQVRFASFLNYDSSDYRRQQCFLTNASTSFLEFNTESCLTLSAEKPNVLLIGDSHSAHLYSAIEQLFPQVHVLQVSASGCKPLIPLTGRKHCIGLMEWLYHQQLNSGFSVDGIVLAALWNKEDLQKMQQTVTLLKTYAPVFVVGPSIQYSQALPRLLSNYPPEQLAQQFSNYQKIKRLDSDYQTAIPAMGAAYISLYQQLCPNDRCRALTPSQIPVQWDTSHFTKPGAMMLVQPAFSSMVKQVSQH